MDKQDVFFELYEARNASNMASVAAARAKQHYDELMENAARELRQDGHTEAETWPVISPDGKLVSNITLRDENHPAANTFPFTFSKAGAL